MDPVNYNRWMRNIRICVDDENTAIKKRRTALNLVKFDENDAEIRRYVENVQRDYMLNVNTNNILRLAHLDSIASTKNTNVAKIKRRMKNSSCNWLLEALDVVMEEIDHDMRDATRLKDPFEYMTFVDRYLHHHFGFRLEHTLEPSNKRGLHVDCWQIRSDNVEQIKRSMSHSIKERSQ
jgi:hypothetical protein